MSRSPVYLPSQDVGIVVYCLMYRNFLFKQLLAVSKDTTVIQRHRNNILCQSIKLALVGSVSVIVLVLLQARSFISHCSRHSRQFCSFAHVLSTVHFLFVPYFVLLSHRICKRNSKFKRKIKANLMETQGRLVE